MIKSFDKCECHSFFLFIFIFFLFCWRIGFICVVTDELVRFDILCWHKMSARKVNYLSWFNEQNETACGKLAIDVGFKLNLEKFENWLYASWNWMIITSGLVSYGGGQRRGKCAWGRSIPRHYWKFQLEEPVKLNTLKKIIY